MLPVQHPTSYSNQVVYTHRFSGYPQHPNQPQQRPLFYPPTPEQVPPQQVVEATSTFPSPVFATQPPYYQPQPPPLPNNWPPQHPTQTLVLAQLDDISPAFKGKAFIYDCMVRALESLSSEGASVKDIFDHVWLNNRAFILARSRDGDTEASRRASTKNTIVNYLSTSPAFESIGRNRWVLTGKRHGADKRGGKISRSTKRRPPNSSFDNLGGRSAGASSSNPSSSSSSSVGNSSSSSSPEISNLPPRRESATGQLGINGSHDMHLATSDPSANNSIVSNRPAAPALPLSNGLIQSSTQASLPSTHVIHHTHDPQLHPHRPQQHHPIVSSLSSHAAPLQPGMSGPNTAIASDHNNHPQRETFSYGQSAQRSTTINATPAAPTTNGGTRRSFDAVPQVLPPRPPRTWQPDILDPYNTPAQTPVLAPAPKTAPATITPPFTAPPSGRLLQIPSNMSYYETPSVTTTTTTTASPVSYMHQEHNPSNNNNFALPPPSMSSSFCSPSMLEEIFAQVDPQVGCAGNSIPVVQQRQHHQQAQNFRDHDPFAAPPGFV